MSVVHLWVDRIDALRRAAAPADAGRWLSASERAQLDGISAPRRRDEFIAGRWLARQCLARAHGGDPLDDWSLSAEFGKPPRVLHSPRRTSPHVAISHSEAWLACATATIAIGLDLEAPTRARDVSAMAERVCTSAERALLGPLDAAARVARFYCLWTLKEAWLKRGAEAATPGRLAELQACEASGRPAQARLWQSGGITLALVAPVDAMLHWQGDAASLQCAAPGLWCIDDRRGGRVA